MWNRKKKRIIALEAALKASEKRGDEAEDQARGWRNAHVEANRIADKALKDWQNAKDQVIYWRVQRSTPWLTRNAKPMYDSLNALRLSDEEKTEPTLAEILAIEDAKLNPVPPSQGPIV